MTVPLEAFVMCVFL
ncbi:DUF1196 domain-containing protein, partial [Vibrio cholerae]|nr:DUF1196 domain-containing protein [Vibrio paracholerae]